MTMVGPYLRKAFAQGDMDNRHPQLRPDPGVPGVGVLRPGHGPGGPGRRRRRAGGPDRQGRGRARGGPRRPRSATSGERPSRRPPWTSATRSPTRARSWSWRQTFEDTGVSAYNGAAPSIQSKELLATAGTIVQVEARHAAAIRLLNGEEPAPDAFDPTLDMQAGPGGRRSRSSSRGSPGTGTEGEPGAGRNARPPARKVRA